MATPDGNEDLKRAMSALLGQMNNLRADMILDRMLIQHTLAMIMKGSPDVHGIFNSLRESSRRGLAEGLRFEGGDPKANDALRQRVLQRHEQTFQELARALGLPEQQS